MDDNKFKKWLYSALREEKQTYKKQHIIILVVSALLIAWLFDQLLFALMLIIIMPIAFWIQKNKPL